MCRKEEKMIRKCLQSLLVAITIVFCGQTLASSQVTAEITISSAGKVSVSPNLTASEFLDAIDKDGGLIVVTVKNNLSSAFQYDWTGYGVTGNGDVINGIVSQNYKNTISANGTSYHLFNVASNSSNKVRMVYVRIVNISKKLDVLIGGRQKGLEYTISYKPGANGVGSPVSVTKDYDSSLTLKGAIFTRDGYLQTGWATSDGGPKVYDLNGSYTANKGVTLYPVWTQHVATKYGLFVGINEYIHPENALLGCVSDVNSMKMVCVDYGDWLEENIELLTDGNATLSQYRSKISDLASKAAPGDTVIIFYSGHGGNSETAPKDSYLFTHDEKYYWDDDFATDLGKFSSGVKVIVILDACHSAGMFKSVSEIAKESTTFASTFISNVSAAIDRNVTKSVGEKGIASTEIGWIAAANYDTTSADINGMGLFTGFMIVDSGILAGNADANSDNVITFKELYEHAAALSDRYSFLQVAQAANLSVLSSVSVNNRCASLTSALDNSSIVFHTDSVYKNDGPASWVGQNLKEGSFARSAVIANSNEARIGFSASGAGEISFKWKVSSEQTYDKLSFVIDDVVKDSISGESEWATKKYAVGEGQHKFVWSYSKDRSDASGDDCGWLDQIVWTPTPVLPDAPTGVSATDGTYSDKVSISWTGSSGATSYNLYRSTTSTRPSAAMKTGVTSPYSDTTATPGTKYYYWVSAVNSAGSSYSSYDTGYRSVLLSVGATTASFDAEGGTGTIAVTANTSWSATADVDWITFTTSSGSGSGNVVYIVAANPSARPRKDGRITITAGTVTEVITVTQDGVEIVILPDLSFATFGSWAQDETSVYVSDVWSNDAVRVCGKGKVFGVNYGFGNFGDAIASGTITNLVEIMDEHMNVVLTEYDSWTISLAQNRGYANNFMLTTKLKNLPAGPYTARVTLDAFNAIRESDESDNTYSYKFAVSDPVSLNEALDNATLTFVSDEKSGWFGTKGLGADGVDAAQSIHNGNSSISSLQTIVTGPGTIAFKWKVSSEEDYDELRFLVDGVMRLSKSGTEGDWEECSYELSSGTHIVTWSYCKDGSYYDGGDCGWVDQVVWTSNASQSDIVIPGVVTLPKAEVESFMAKYPSLAAQAGGDAEAFVKLPSAMGKLDANGNQMYVWQDIVAGTDPTNPYDKFRIVDIKFEDGEIKVMWSPDLNENGTKNVRKYTEFGRKKLGGTETWMDMNGIAPAKKNDYKFRKVTVEMP